MNKEFKGHSVDDSLISRQAAINALKEYFSDEDRTDTEYGAYWHHKHVLDVLRKLPPAQPEKAQLSTEGTTKNTTSDCISRQAALRRLEAYRDEDIIDIEEVISSIGHLPAVQPEIIRCKDCKYADDDGVCQNSIGLVIQDDDDFCSRAERRTDE